MTKPCSADSPSETCIIDKLLICGGIERRMRIIGMAQDPCTHALALIAELSTWVTSSPTCCSSESLCLARFMADHGTGLETALNSLESGTGDYDLAIEVVADLDWHLEVLVGSWAADLISQPTLDRAVSAVKARAREVARGYRRGDAMVLAVEDAHDSLGGGNDFPDAYSWYLDFVRVQGLRAV